MKTLSRNIVFYSVSLFLLSQFISGLVISGGWTSYVLGGVVLSLLFMIVRPVLGIITLPLTIITLGWFSLITNAIILYLLTILVNDISITSFVFQRSEFAGFVIPRISVNTVFAFIVISILISVTVGIFKWLIKK
jgi:putative membrane protein